MIGRLIGIAGVGALLLAAGFAAFAVAIMRTSPDPVQHADAIVVLTGGDQRIQEGLKLFGESGVKRVLISGVNRSTTREDLRRHSELNSVLFDCCVDIGYEALDTIGNAEETKLWAETWNFKRLIVVTSNYHMPRSLLELARTMPDATLFAHPVLPRQSRVPGWWLSLGSMRLVVSEYVKVIPAAGRWALGRILGPVSAARSIPDPVEPGLPSALSPQGSPRISGL